MLTKPATTVAGTGPRLAMLKAAPMPDGGMRVSAETFYGKRSTLIIGKGADFAQACEDFDRNLEEWIKAIGE